MLPQKEKKTNKDKTNSCLKNLGRIWRQGIFTFLQRKILDFFYTIRPISSTKNFLARRPFSKFLAQRMTDSENYARYSRHPLQYSPGEDV